MNETEFNSLPLAQRKAAQQRLIDAGLYNGAADGRWGPGTATAFKAEEKRRVEDAERERKAKAEQEERLRQLAIEEKRAEAEAAERDAATERTRQQTQAERVKAARKQQYDEDAASDWGMAAKFGANILSPAVTGYLGYKGGQGVNVGLNEAQRFMNSRLQGVAADRVKGLTTRDAARDAVRISGAMPIENRAGRVTARMVPHIGLGGLGMAKGLQILHDSDPDQPYYAYQADRAAGMAYVGAGAGMLKAGMGHASNPQVTPDAQALAVINSNQLRRNGLSGAPTIENATALNRGPVRTLDAEVVNNAEPQKALPQPKQEQATEAKRPYSERLIKAAKSAGATGIKTKADAEAWIAANINDDNRAAIAKELGVKAGPKFHERVLKVAKNMAAKPGASSLLGPLLAGATAYFATPNRANASEDGAAASDAGEALTNGGIAASVAGGVQKAISSVPKVVGQGLSGGLSMMTPFVAADAYSPTQEQLNMDRNIAARYMPAWMRAGGIEDAYQMAQVPTPNPERMSMGPRVSDFDSALADIEYFLQAQQQ